MPQQNKIDKFWSRVDKSGDCWEWTAGKSRGYGRLRLDGIWWLAHRLAYAMTHGPIPDNLVVRHACDNRACVNPAHLSTGTHYDNAQDRVERNRSPIGAAHPRAKLTEEEVFWIWDLRHLGKAKLSRLFDVSKGCIAGIIKRRNWRVLLFNR